MYASTMAFCEDLRIRAHLDGQTTIGLNHLAGLGKAWHIHTAKLCVKDALERREFEPVKFRGERNPADVITKPALDTSMKIRLVA